MVRILSRSLLTERQSIARMKLQATIAISRLAKSQSTEYTHLRKIMEDITHMATKKYGKSGLGAEVGLCGKWWLLGFVFCFVFCSI
jgi:hypothetical protein